MLFRTVFPFFYFFFTSRFFSEVLNVLPKALDVLNYAYIPLLALVAVFTRPKMTVETDSVMKVSFAIAIIITTIFASIVINTLNVLVPASMLFALGFLEGPILFLALTRMMSDGDKAADGVQKLIWRLFLVNVIVVIVIDLPLFTASGNPDVMSGTFGLNAYYFSAFLVASAGLLIGMTYCKKLGLLPAVAGHVLIIFSFFLLQYRAALLFFALGYAVPLLVLYGRQILTLLMVSIFGGVLLSVVVSLIQNNVEGGDGLKYEDWVELVANPTSLGEYGKFVAYSNTAAMMASKPQSFLVGVGPGNYLSRAYNTFSYEMRSDSDQGVGALVGGVFGMRGPRHTAEEMFYLAPLRRVVVFGSYQLSNPNSSLLAPIAELGLVGGGAILFLYFFMFRKALAYSKLLKRNNSRHLPLATALLAMTTYVIGLAFLDNYWEMSRVTLLLWLMFWGVNAVVRDDTGPKLTVSVPQRRRIPREEFAQ